MLAVTREQAAAFRIARQHLATRLGREDLLAAAAGGIQDSPPGFALLSLGARLQGLSAGDLDRALASERSLLTVWSARGAPYVILMGDHAVFTTGLLPDDDDATHFFIRGASEHLARFGLTASEIVERTAIAVRSVLDGQALSKDDLGVALADAVEATIPAPLRTQWREPDGLRHNTYGQSLVRYALPVVSLRGLVCLIPREGSEAVRIGRTDQWLGRPAPLAPLTTVRAELVRRYLSWFGPSRPALFADWAGVSPAFAGASWGLVADEIAPVEVDGRRADLLASDLPLLADPPVARGVRLLPPHDPLLASRDRATLVPDRALQRRIWRGTGSPGIGLVDGAVVAAWRPRSRGKRLTLDVEPLTALSPATREVIVAEANALGALRGATAVETRFATG